MTPTPKPIVNTVPTVGCRDECGRSVPVSDVESQGWNYLEIQKRYRCPQCWRELNAQQKRAQ